MWRPSFFALVALTFQLLCIIPSGADEPSNELKGARKYVTRPDIEVPDLKVTVYDKDLVSPGYWFVGAYDKLNSRGGKWQAPMIFDNAGELIWSGIELGQGFDVFDFRISNILGEERMTFLHQHNSTVYALDMHYNVVDTIQTTFGDQQFNMHEFYIVENGTRALVLHDYLKTFSGEWVEKMNAAEDGGDRIEICHARENSFRELDVANGWEKVFLWHATDHIDPAENFHGKDPFSERCKNNAWDAYHANSLDKFPDGSYLLSVRHMDALYKISPDGDIIWRLGGRTGWGDKQIGDFEPQPSLFYFLGQHDAKIVEHNTSHTIISLFDNAKETKKRAASASAARGLIISLQEDGVRKDGSRGKVATLVQEYLHPGGDGHVSDARGSMQVLPGGNVFIDWVDWLWHSEHTADGKMVMEGKTEPKRIKSYRSYKFPFVGAPLRAPDVNSTYLADDTTGPSTLVHISWNGATEVASWNVYRTDASGKMTSQSPDANTPRTGFETKMRLPDHASYIVVEALDQSGNVLEHGTSAVIRTVSESDRHVVSRIRDSNRTAWAFGLGFGIVVFFGWRRLVAGSWRKVSMPWWSARTDRGEYQLVFTNKDDR